MCSIFVPRLIPTQIIHLSYCLPNAPLLNPLICFRSVSAGKSLTKELPLSELGKAESNLSITVVGASGDLAKKKIFPALFALYYEDCLPEVLIFTFQTYPLEVDETENIILWSASMGVSYGWSIFVFVSFYRICSEFYSFWLCPNKNDWWGAEKHD